MKDKLAFLLSPGSVLLGMVTGIIIGIYFREMVPYLEPVGKIYISILQMCVIPILAAAIITSIGKLFKSEDANHYIRKIIIVFLVFLIGVSMISVIIGVFSEMVMKVDVETQRAIGKIALSNESENNISTPGTVIKEIDSRKSVTEDDNKNGLISFIINIIPENIFSALARGENLKVIFFFAILGIMLKYISAEASENIILIFDGIFMAFQKLIKVTMYFLPFGLTALMATQLAQVGFAALASLLKFIILLYIVALIIFLISTVIIWRQGSRSYFQQFKALGEPLLICLGTRNSFAAVPSAISGLSNELKFNQERINLSVPLGVSLCRYGNVMVFSLGAVFATQLYGYSLGVEKIIIIIITSVLAGMATSGAPGLVARTMIVLVLTPLGIPAEAIIAMLLAIDPVIDSITTVINVYPNLVASAIIASDGKEQIKTKDTVILQESY